MKRYFKYFMIPFIITIIIVVVSLGIGISGKIRNSEERYNTSWDNTECVYDWAGKMTDSEIASLNDRIMYWQEKCHADIVWITIDDAEYGYLSAVKEFGEWFTEEYGLGYTGSNTDSFVFVDNWSRGGDGKIHTWITTTGSRIRNNLTDSEVEEILYILDEIPSDDSDPYVQYMEILDKCGKQTRAYHPPFAWFYAFIAGIIAAGLFILLNWRSKLGDNTVTSSTYLEGGKAQFPVLQDIFNHKTVTKHKIESSSSGSGGGGGGGGSHGGGGHSR